jgi:hypothetical protein
MRKSRRRPSRGVVGLATIAVVLLVAGAASRGGLPNARRATAATVKFHVEPIDPVVPWSRHVLMNGTLRFRGTISNDTDASITVTRMGLGSVGVHRMHCREGELPTTEGPILFDEDPRALQRDALTLVPAGGSADITFHPLTVNVREGALYVVHRYIAGPSQCTATFQYEYREKGPPDTLRRAVLSNEVAFELTGTTKSPD